MAESAGHIFGPPSAAGYARLAAWSDLLDEINVFPVADGDTGRNLCISLAPLRALTTQPVDEVRRRLLHAATGNSGNIAVAFLARWLDVTGSEELASAAAAGARSAREAVGAPVSGTMLDVFDALADSIPVTNGQPAPFSTRLLPPLAAAVEGTMQRLPVLAKAQLIDAGALAMYLFFEAFFSDMDGRPSPAEGLPAAFDSLTRHRFRRPTSAPEQATRQELCVNALVKPTADTDPNAIRHRLDLMGGSAVVLGDEQHLKIHLHAGDLAAAKAKLAGIGTIEAISTEDLYGSVPAEAQLPPGPVHILTDAAGSLTRLQARQLGATLLDSFVVADGAAVPETLLDAEEVYGRMRSGARVSTAQMANTERHQHYAAIRNRFEKVLYLTVGSAYTGNAAAAREWQQSHDPDGRLTVLDTGAASGRLGLIALATARFASRASGAQEVVRFAKMAMADCEELVFLDQLKYLAAGGRISKTGGFFGDLFGVKPVVSPKAGGVEKVAVVRHAGAQLPLALEHLDTALAQASAPLILLQHTDNRQRVTDEIRPALEARFPGAEILLSPLSLTAGVHMGPGTWAVAWLADPSGDGISTHDP